MSCCVEQRLFNGLLANDLSARNMPHLDSKFSKLVLLFVLDTRWKCQFQAVFARKLHQGMTTALFSQRLPNLDTIF